MRERNKEQLVRGFVVVVGSSVTNTNSYAQKKSRSKRKSVVDKNFTESVKLARADKSWAWKIAIACDGSQQETQDTVFHGRCSRISECGRLGVARAKVRRFEEFRSQQAGWKSRWSSLEDKKKRLCKLHCVYYTPRVVATVVGHWIVRQSERFRKKCRREGHCGWRIRPDLLDGRKNIVRKNNTIGSRKQVQRSNKAEALKQCFLVGIFGCFDCGKVSRNKV